MDVPSGQCWRCEKILPDQHVHCGDCPIAQYCTTSCRDRDSIRHTSVECQIFGPKKCSKCGKKGTMKECKQCNNAWYCNKECQLANWSIHKQSCVYFRETIKEVAGLLVEKHSEGTIFGDAPYYFGNIIARDYLKLVNNEWSEEVMEEDLARDYQLLSVGCGDLRNTVLTAASLPARYQGSLYITLNDFDPFVMARNVLFLFMLVRFADTEGIESSLTTIWYSVHITKKEYDLIKTSLDELIQMTPQSLTEVTQGLVKVQGEDLELMSQVWGKWKSLECRRKNNMSINLRQQRKALLQKENAMTGLFLYIFALAPNETAPMKAWVDHGMFLPTEAKEKDMPFDNPTITGKTSLMGKLYLTKEHVQKDPKDHLLMYCIKSDSFPFVVWDCLRVRESETRPCSSPMVMYHSYITNLLQKVKSLIQQQRLYIQISLVDCMDFPSVHKSLKMSEYDRISTSNLTDYVGIAQLLQLFKPLLNSSNKFSVIVTEAMNWIRYLPDGNIKMLMMSPEYVRCEKACREDTDSSMTIGISNLRDYFNNTPHFLLYLRAQIMAGGVGGQPLTNVPSFEEVMKYNGLQMRDFRKKLNHLVPFQYRVNARVLTMMNGNDRAVEWCLQHTDG
ncbi:uncharacterized protein LOC117296566 isoform X1 [Asterias rubens]|uniref:uncharacterized protein LOC117296566 isoform X1 n=1 Tax=Asterias rubens TaxID=7604 RepID=UPI0014552C76|nr:uncharacterized protein LOC117296566 isoform X1 [Asterias rubens]